MTLGATSRFGILCACVAQLLLPARGRGGAVPFRVLYDNDSTNLTSCISPWRHWGEITSRQLRGLVDEVADTQVDAYLFCPGLGNGPWWPSEAEPDYWQWWQRHFGRGPGPWGRFVTRGGDPAKITLDRVTERGMAPFISFRVNDQQGIRACRLWHDRPECRLSHPPAARKHTWSWELECFDFTHPAVRAYKLALIAELIRRYDIAGFQLDFMRQPLYFKVAQTTPEQRVEIMTGFVRRVRALLDAKAGKRRYLCLRIPNRLSRLDYMGLDLGRLADEGLVDMLNLSPWLVHQQENDLPQFRKLLPHAALYCEMTPGVHYELRRNLYGRQAGDGKVGRLATRHTYHTTALQAYDLGADGVSLFNFVYTRPSRTRAGMRTGIEPPFQVLIHGADRAWLAKQPQHYVLATRFGTWCTQAQLPVSVAAGQAASVTIHAVAQDPSVRSPAPALLRMELSRPVRHGQWAVCLNRTRLSECAPREDPFQHYYGDRNRLEPGHALQFAVPAALIRPGPNIVAFELVQGAPARLVYLDLSVGTRHHPLGR